MAEKTTGKRQRREPEVNAVPGQKGELLFVHDSNNGIKWLVDSGALYSIVPPSLAQRAQGQQPNHLQAANGSKIPCYGSVAKKITLGSKSFEFEFIVADVKHHILGADFLAENYLAPNQRDGSLLDLHSFDTIPTVVAQGESPSHVTFINEVNSPFYQLLDQYPDIMTPTFTLKEVKHGIRHHIPTEGFPVQFRARRLNPEKLAIAKEELGKLEKLGICYRGKSEWASPLMVTTKPDGGWRVCGDYRRLNSMTPDDRYPVRTLQDFTSELQGKKIFSKIDILKAYHQIPVAEEDVAKTAVITPFGLFIFPRTPFGLKNAGQDFQRLMDQIFGEVPRVFVYIDDILVASVDEKEHLHDLKVVLDSLRENGLVTNRKKCILGRTSLEFLGYLVDANGISPLPERVAAIREFQRPTSIKELQRFLGMVNYYRRFIPRAAHHLRHLFDALHGKPKDLVWDEGCQISFEATKEALAQATLLHHPRSGAHLALTTDASQFAVGGVLEQWGPKGWEPLSFYSKKLNDSQQLWPPYDRELLGAFNAVRYFRPMIEGRPFTLFTDHLSLVPSMSKKSDPQTSRQAYQLSAVAEFTTDFRYIQGKANVVADSLSRPPGSDTNNVTYQDSYQSSEASALASGSNTERSGSAAAHNEAGSSVKTASEGRESAELSQPLGSIPTATHNNDNNEEQMGASSPSSSPSSSSSLSSSIPPQERDVKQEALEDLGCLINSVEQMNLSLEDMARDQAMDPDFRRVSADARTGLQLRAVDLGRRKLIVDVSNGPARPFVPFSWRRRVFDIMHGLGHPGVERTRQTVAAKFVWPSLKQDVTRWARECLHCQRAKVLRHVAPPIGDFEVPPKRFEHLNLDLVTLTPSNGFKYLLTIVDRFSRWPVAIPLKDMTVDTILDAFAHGWVATYGVPASITTDRGSQFLSAAWAQLMATWGIKSHTTTAYHPEANGMVERLHRRLKEAILACSHDNPNEWYWKLPTVMLSLRTTLKPDLGASPAEMLFGEPLSVPGSLLSNAPPSDEQLHQQQHNTLSNLRLEVARLQPTPTSAHRQQNVRLPQDLRTCTHVFIRKGTHHGTVNPCLASPYSGPYRVLSREDHYFRVSIPGRGAESVALARLKPAVIASDRELQQNPTPVTPPPRRGPGRPRTRREDPPPTPAPPPPPPPSVGGRGRPRRLPHDAPPQLLSPPPARRRGPPRKCNNANTNSVVTPSLQAPHFPLPEEEQLPPPSPEPQSSLPPLPHHSTTPVSHSIPEPNSSLSQQSFPADGRERESENAGAAARVTQTGSGQQPNPVQTGSSQSQPRAAASEAAPPFFTRPEQRRFSAQRGNGTRANISYAASLAAIMQQHLAL